MVTIYTLKSMLEMIKSNYYNNNNFFVFSALIQEIPEGG